MSRARSFQIKLLPAALAAALVMLGSATVTSAQSYDQAPPSDQSASQYEDAQSDPSSRVARLAYLSGDVEFAPAGESDFGSADVNRPLTTGDRLLTGDDGRAALELGGAALRIDHGSAFNFLDLNDSTTQVELSQGSLNLRVRDVGQNQTYEIDTPTVAFVASQPGMYRVDVAPDGNGAMVTVFDGAGTVYGENGASRALDAGQSYRFNDSALSNVEVSGLPESDDFDRWAEARDNRWENSESRRYVSPEVVGYDDLDDYGAWNDTADYGEVWYPTQVYAGWAPYRDGHWAWIDPWGWTWVDNAPWGFAPFHYGRWVYVGNRWGWCPGPRQYRPVYAPALVAFVGGSGFSVSISLGGGSPVGWFPLGPRDVYVPWYRASRNYFTNVNVTNIRNVYVNKTVINNYYGNYAAQRPMNEARYAYRNDAHAFTAVPRNVFTGAKPVRNAVLHVPPRALAQAQVVPPHIAPTKASLAIRPPSRPIATPARAFDRTVIAKHTPPPRPVPFAARERVIAKQGGAPIPVAQLQQMRQRQAQARPQERVQVVAAKPQNAKPLPPMKRVQNLAPSANRAPITQAPGRAPVRAPENNAGKYPPGQAHISPIQVPVHPANGAAAQNLPKPTSLRPGELPSARFAHPQRTVNPAAPSAPERETQSRVQQEQQRGQAEQQQAQMHNQQAQQHALQAQQAQQKAEQARAQQQQAQQREAQSRQQAEQARVQQQQTQQREAQARQRDEQMRAQQAQQRAEQDRAQQQAQQRQAQMEQQRAEQARAQQQQAQQREAQARQRDEQMRAQQAQQQRADQARQAQMMQQQREAQQAAQQQQRAQQVQHAPPQPHQPPPPPKKKDHDDQDNGH